MGVLIMSARIFGPILIRAHDCWKLRCIHIYIYVYSYNSSVSYASNIPPNSSWQLFKPIDYGAGAPNPSIHMFSVFLPHMLTRDTTAI